MILPILFCDFLTDVGSWNVWLCHDEFENRANSLEFFAIRIFSDTKLPLTFPDEFPDSKVLDS